MYMHVYLLVPRNKETKFFRRDPMVVPGYLLLSFCFVLSCSIGSKA